MECSVGDTTDHVGGDYVSSNPHHRQITQTLVENQFRRNPRVACALTVGTRDGATIKMAQEAGEENLFLFGLTAQEVQVSRGGYNPQWRYQHDVDIREALDMIFKDHFSRDEPGIFTPIRETLLDRGDYFMHLADLRSYAEAQQHVGEMYSNSGAWDRKAIINVACSGKFSSDRTIKEYATDIWKAGPCPVI